MAEARTEHSRLGIASFVLSIVPAVLLAGLVPLVLIWLYILVAGAPPSAIRAGVIATFVLAARLFGRQISPLHCTN